MAESRDITQFMPLAKKALNSALAKVPPHTDRDQLWSAAMGGLMEAHARYDPAKGKFEQYAWSIMRARILDALRRMDWMPRNARALFKRMGRARQEFEIARGRLPTDLEMAELMGVKPAEYKDMVEYTTVPAIMSLDEAFGETPSEDDQKLHNVIAAPEPDPIRAHMKELLPLILRALPLLTEQQALVIRKYYFEERTLGQIAQEQNLTESRICQVHTQAIAGMRILFARWEKTGLMPIPFSHPDGAAAASRLQLPPRMSKIRWTDDELHALADEFVKQRIAHPFTNVGQVLHNAQSAALPENRRRDVASITVIGDEFMGMIRRRMAKLVIGGTVLPTSPPDAVREPPKPEAVPVPTIVEVKVPEPQAGPQPSAVAPEDVLRSYTPGFLMGFAVERMLSNMAHALVNSDPSRATMPAISVPAPSAVKPESAPAAVATNGNGHPHRVLIVGLPREQRDEFRLACDKTFPRLQVHIFGPGELAPKIDCDTVFVLKSYVSNTQDMLTRNRYGERVVFLDTLEQLAPRLSALNTP